MIWSCALTLALACPNSILSNCAAGVPEVSVQEQLLGTIPGGLELEGPPIIGPDGKSYPNVRSVSWSPDGRQVAYVGLRGNMPVAVVGDEELGSFQFAGKPTFGATGDQILFRVGNRKKDNKSEEWWLLSGDGERLYEQDWIGIPRFSPDGTRIATWIQPGAKIAGDGSYVRRPMNFLVATQKKAKWTFHEGDEYEDGRALQSPLFTPDSELVATLASERGKWFVLTASGKRQKAFDKQRYTRISDFALSDNGKQLAVVAMDPAGADSPAMPPGMAGMSLPGSRSLIFHGKEKLGREYDDVGCPVFSPRGKHLAFKVLRDGKMGIAIDDDSDALASWDFVFAPVFSADGKRFGYVAVDGYTPSPFFALSREGEQQYAGGQALLVVEDVRRKKRETSADAYLDIRDLVWDEPGARTAFRARTEQGWVAVCGETQSEPYDEMGPVHFTADGKQLAFGARSDRELWWRVLALE